MADLIADTGARGEQTPAVAADPQQTGTGTAQAPGGSQAPSKNMADMTMGQESYAGPRAAGETDKPTSPDQQEFDPAQERNPALNNAQTPPAGDVNPEDTAVTDATGQAGVNDRPGKNKAHPWNG